MKQISRVLAAVDFSVPARSADEHALALARHHAAELFVDLAAPTPGRWPVTPPQSSSLTQPHTPRLGDGAATMVSHVATRTTRTPGSTGSS